MIDFDAQVSGTNTWKGFVRLWKGSVFFKGTKVLRNRKKHAVQGKQIMWKLPAAKANQNGKRGYDDS